MYQCLYSNIYSYVCVRVGMMLAMHSLILVGAVLREHGDSRVLVGAVLREHGDSRVLVGAVLREHGDERVEHDLGLGEVGGGALDEDVARRQRDLAVVACVTSQQSINLCS